MSQISDEPILNTEHLEVLTTLSDNDPREFIVDLFDTFKATWPDVSSRIKSSSDIKDEDSLRKAVHQLNGSAANIGMSRLSLVCQDIESKIQANNYTDHETCYTIIEDEYKQAKGELQKFLDNL